MNFFRNLIFYYLDFSLVLALSDWKTFQSCLCSILPRLRRRKAFWRLLLLCIRYFLAFRESTGFLPAPTTTTTFTEVEEGKCSSLGRGEVGIGRNSKALPIIQLILQTFPPISWEFGWKIVGESFFRTLRKSGYGSIFFKSKDSISKIRNQSCVQCTSDLVE